MSSPYLTILANSLDYPDLNECFDWEDLRPSTNCPDPGFFVEIMGIITKRLNITAKFINADGPEFLSQIDNSTGISSFDFGLDLIRNGTADLFESYFDNTNGLGGGLELTNTIYLSETKFIVASAGNALTGAFDFFTFYDLKIWIGIFGCTLFVILLYLLIYQVGSRLTVNESTTFSSFAWQIFRLQLAQISTVKQKLVSSNCLMLVFVLFQSGIVIRMYNNLITTQAVRYVNPKPFKGSELLQVLQQKKYSFIFHNKLRWWYQEITKSMESPYFEIRKAIQNNPIQLASDYEEGWNNLETYVMNRVQRGKWITIGSYEDVSVSRHNGYCNMVYFDTNFPPRQKSFLMRYNNPLLPLINEVILQETINIRKLHDKPSACSKKPESVKPLNLTPFYGVILAFLIGVFVAHVVFFVELFLFKRKRK